MTHARVNMHSLQAPLRGALAAARVGAAALTMVAACAVSAAPTVLFVATDLADTMVGQDLWRYDYTISGPVDSFGSVNLLFAPASFANLQSQSADPNVSLVDVQPDTGAPADGIVYATMLAGLLAADTAALSVDFVWLGGAGTAPGAQPFEVVDGSGFPAGRGVSRPASGGGTVPEPTAWLLTATALLALSIKRKRGLRA